MSLVIAESEALKLLPAAECLYFWRRLRASIVREMVAGDPDCLPEHLAWIADGHVAERMFDGQLTLMISGVCMCKS